MTGLLDLLGAREGIVCAAGAGGKKSVLFAIAAQHPGRMAFTTTVHTLPPPSALKAQIVIAPPAELADAVQHAGSRLIAYACPGDKPGRLTGVPPALIGELHDALSFDLTLVKADGARMRWVKAPAVDEPVIPPGMATFIPVISARALGEPLGERIAHRIERIATITGAEPGQTFTAAHAARLLASEDGLLKGASDALVVPVINMVDDPDRQRLATEAAREALRLTRRFRRVVLARLNRAQPVVEIIER